MSLASPELDVSIRYGFTDEQKAEKMAEQADKIAGSHEDESISFRVFGQNEDIQWCTGVVMSRNKRGSWETKIRRTDEPMRKLRHAIEIARDSGKVPFRVAGPHQLVPEFLTKAGIVDKELIV